MRTGETPRGPFTMDYQLPDPTRTRWSLNGGDPVSDWEVALDEVRSPVERLPDDSVVRIVGASGPLWVGVVSSSEAAPLRMTPAKAERLARRWQGRTAVPASMLDGEPVLDRRTRARIAVALARTCEELLPRWSGPEDALRAAERVALDDPEPSTWSAARAAAAVRDVGDLCPTSARKAAEACFYAAAAAFGGAYEGDPESVSLVAMEAAAAYAWSIESLPMAHERRRKLASSRHRYLAEVVRSVVPLGEFLRLCDAATPAEKPRGRRARAEAIGSLVQPG